MTELILFNRPSNGSIRFNDIRETDTSILARGANLSGVGGIAEPNSAAPEQYFNTKQANTPISPVAIGLVRPAAQGPQGLRVDLYDDISLPITFTIADIKEPDKRKTSWSKTISIPGTKNNNRIFNHIYELNKDGWMTIGSQSFYQGFNPNIRKEVIVVQDGIQVFKGNLQLKSARKFFDGNVEYEVIVNGDLTSLFFDIGEAKLQDLDYSKYTHDWSKANITNSWFGINTLKDGSRLTSISNGALIDVVGIERDSATGRVLITTNTPHNYKALDFVFLCPNNNVISNSSYDGYKTIMGVWSVSTVPTSTKFTVNCQYTTGLLALGTSAIPIGHFFSTKQTANGRGWAYPMVSWGNEFDQNSFPVVSFTPGIFVKDIFDKIFESANSKYTSEFLNSEFFKRLILIEKKGSYEQTSYEIAERSFRVGTSAKFTTNTTSISGGGIGGAYNFTRTWYWAQTTIAGTVSNGLPAAQNIKFTQETGGLGSGVYYDGSFGGYTTGANNWNADNSTWNVAVTGEYDLTASLELSAKAILKNFDGTVSLGGFAPSTYTYYPTSREIVTANGSMPLGNGSEGLAVKLALIRERNGVKTTLSESMYAMPLDKNQPWTTLYPFNGQPAPGWLSFTASEGIYSPGSWNNVTLKTQSGVKYFAKGDIVYSELTYYVQGKPASVIPGIGLGTVLKRANLFHQYDPNGANWNARYRDINTEIHLSIDVPSFITCRPTGKIIEGSPLNQQSFLPKDLTCKDFLTSIIKMFNLHIQPDVNLERKYVIEPREDFYYNGSSQSHFVDWSKKIDYDTIKITPMGELGAKTYTFENKDENDYWNTKFKNERGRPYMQYKKVIQNDFLKNEYKISLPFGSSVMINNPENSDVVMPAIHQQENGVMRPISQTAPRILLWMGARPYTANGKLMTINTNRTGWEFLSSVEAVQAQYQAPYGQALSASASIAASASDCFFYPYAGTVDSPTEPFWDINWFNQEVGDFVYWDSARWTNHNLYNTYWKGFITEISDPSSLVVEADVNLTATDIADLDFRKIHVIDGIWYRLQKVIDYDAIGKGSTKVELLKVKAPTKFTRISTWTGEPIDRNVDYDRNVTILEVSYAPPKKRIISEGYSNNMNSSFLSNATIDVNGKGNFVSQGDSIKVNGNENIVGEGASSIHISNGNGNFIAGGLKNVTIIGTDKKVIRESNISYINGIRYKNGVPISRTNVIDGSLDAPTSPTALNTIANIVDGAEDVVIKKGSASYEDVIDAGQDAILPDVAELGISTSPTPRPKTNLSGGYAQEVGSTQSLVDIVREAARYMT